MQFSFHKSIQVLQNTPVVISSLLNNLGPEWTSRNEGVNTWNVRQVLAHLVVCEETNWLPRAKIILAGNGKIFEPIDMEAHFAMARDQPVSQMLEQFKLLRKNSLNEMMALAPADADLKKTGVHPKLGTVSLQELMAAWVTHDLAHTAQMARVMAKQNKTLIGGFVEFFPSLS